MSTRKGAFWCFGRAAALTAVAGMALTTVEPSLAMAGPASSGKGPWVATASSDATDFSAARRRHYRYSYRRNGGAAAAAAAAGIIGLGLGIAAAQNRRAYYDDYYGYGGPAYYGPGPYYYGYGW